MHPYNSAMAKDGAKNEAKNWKTRLIHSDVQVPEGYRSVVSGLPVLRVGIVRDLEQDQVRLMPLAGILYLITLALAFRKSLE